MSSNARTVWTVLKLSLFVAFAVVALMEIRHPAVAPNGDCRCVEEKNETHGILEQQPAEGDVIIALVDGRPIYRSDFLRAYQSLSPQAQQYGLAMIFPVLQERLVDEKLLAAVAVNEISPDDPELVTQIRRMTEQAQTEIYFTREIDAAVTEDAVRARYDESVADFKSVEEVSARHILLETEEKAKEVLEMVKGGADFAETAKEHSTGPSAANGGDLGFFTHDQMVAPFADAAFTLQAGEIFDTPVQSEFGWHVIKVEDRRQTEPPSFEEQRDQITGELTREVATALLDSLRSAATIEKFDYEGNPVPAAPQAPGGAEQSQPAQPQDAAPAQQ